MSSLLQVPAARLAAEDVEGLPSMIDQSDELVNLSRVRLG